MLPGDDTTLTASIVYCTQFPRSQEWNLSDSIPTITRHQGRCLAHSPYVNLFTLQSNYTCYFPLCQHFTPPNEHIFFTHGKFRY